MNSFLDDLFQWAWQEPKSKVVSVQVSLVISSVTVYANRTFYAEGALYYPRPATKGATSMFVGAQYFASKGPALKAYLSTNPGGSANTFDPVDPWSVIINKPGVVTGDYSITVGSKGWSDPITAELTGDVSYVSYGSGGGGFVTVSLCDRVSKLP